MLGEVDKGVILVTAGANNTDDRLPFLIGQTVIGTIATGTLKLLNVSWFSTFPLLI